MKNLIACFALFTTFVKISRELIVRFWLKIALATIVSGMVSGVQLVEHAKADRVLLNFNYRECLQLSNKLNLKGCGKDSEILDSGERGMLFDSFQTCQLTESVDQSISISEALINLRLPKGASIEIDDLTDSHESCVAQAMLVGLLCPKTAKPCEQMLEIVRQAQKDSWEPNT